MVVHAFNPRTQEAETRGSLWVEYSLLYIIVPRQPGKDPVSKIQEKVVGEIDDSAI